MYFLRKKFCLFLALIVGHFICYAYSEETSKTNKTNHHKEAKEAKVEKVEEKSKPTPKLSIEVYYEVLCPDSIKFFTHQLYPTYRAIGEVLDITLLPYGKAIQNRDYYGNWVFDCQHGPSECYGNKVQGCILNLNISFANQMQIINCMLSSSNPSNAGRKCAGRSNVPYEPILECVDSKKGDEILAMYGDLTHSLTPNLSFVPTVTFNNTYNYELQNAAFRNLLKTCCNLIAKKDWPAGCSTYMSYYYPNDIQNEPWILQ